MSYLKNSRSSPSSDNRPSCFDIIHPLFIRNKSGISWNRIRSKSERRKTSDSDSNAHRSRCRSTRIPQSIVFIGRNRRPGWKLPYVSIHVLTIIHARVVAFIRTWVRTFTKTFRSRRSRSALTGGHSAKVCELSQRFRKRVEHQNKYTQIYISKM